MLAAMNIAPTRWYELGAFRILQQPLPGNHFMATHWIYRGARLIGKLLSVPSLQDCKDMERKADQPAFVEWAESAKNTRARLRGVAKARKRPKA